MDLQQDGLLLVADGNHGEYRPRRHEFGEEGTSFIRAADMANGRVLFDSAQKINDVAMQRIRKGIGAGGDVILSHKGTVGKVAFVPLDAPPFVCSPQTTFWRTLDNDQIDRRYLCAYLNSRNFHDQLYSRANETDMAGYVSLTAQRSLTVVLPPIDEQRRIAHILGTLDDKIELNRKMNETLEAMAQALFQSWFVDFDPVIDKILRKNKLGAPSSPDPFSQTPSPHSGLSQRERSTGETGRGISWDDSAIFDGIPDELQDKAEIRRKVLASGRSTTDSEAVARANFPDEFVLTDEIGWIPKGWEVRTVDDVCELVVDCPHSTPKWTDSGVIVIRTSNFKDGMLDLEETRFTDETHYKKRVKRAVPTAGDVLITREAPMGLVALIPDGVRLCMGQRMVLLRADPVELKSILLYRFLLSPNVQRQIAWNEGTGSTVSNLRIPALKDLLFATPGPQRQVVMAAEIQGLQDRKHFCHAENRVLLKLRDTLLPKLVCGKHPNSWFKK